MWFTRRRLLAAALSLSTARAIAAPSDTTEPVVKISQAEAQYQSSPKGLLKCAACTFFIKPTSCKVVTGAISPNGWCKLFDLPD